MTRARPSALWVRHWRPYPECDYPVPSKHSFFHHLANQYALLDLELSGAKNAAEGLALRVEKDERFETFFAQGIEQVFLDAGAAGELKVLYAQVADALEGRDRAAAEDLRARKLPDLRSVDGDPLKRYVVLGAAEGKDDRPLVLILPGGNGQANDFLPWLTKLTAPLTDEYLFAILSAPTWSEEQKDQVVWVTETWKKEFKAKFTVEEFASEVAKELRPKSKGGHYLFAWSSGGPASYATVLRKGKMFRGAYLLSSVFKKDQLATKYARGKRFVFEQGVEDKVTAFHFAEAAEKELNKRGAKTHLVSFDGGHGFAMPDPKASLRRALEWLTDK